MAVVDVDDDAGRKTVSDIRSAGGTAEYWHMDVSDSTQVAAVLAQINKKFGKINVLVNNAGISGPQIPSDEVAEEEWDRVMRVDAKGVFLCTKYGAPYLKEAGGGSIVNISSIYGLAGRGGPCVSCGQGGGETPYQVGRLLLRTLRRQGKLHPSGLYHDPHGGGVYAQRP